MRWCFESGAHLMRIRFSTGWRPATRPWWFYEASAVLSRAQNIGTLTASKAAAFITELKSLNIIADDAGIARVLTDVHRMALSYRLTSYDAAYLELATRLNLPLATLDDELIRAAGAAGIPVL